MKNKTRVGIIIGCVVILALSIWFLATQNLSLKILGSILAFFSIAALFESVLRILPRKWVKRG
jgi:hypothetical protein